MHCSRLAVVLLCDSALSTASFSHSPETIRFKPMILSLLCFPVTYQVDATFRLHCHCLLLCMWQTPNTTDCLFLKSLFGWSFAFAVCCARLACSSFVPECRKKKPAKVETWRAKTQHKPCCCQPSSIDRRRTFVLCTTYTPPYLLLLLL